MPEDVTIFIKGLTVDGTLDPERLSILNSVSNICGPSAESEALEWDE